LQNRNLQQSNPLRPIAIYLPQFHPIPENDEWWGPGFTEWRNVVKARPRFKGHYQPHLPRDLGYYDLRLEETRIQQANLAKEYGIHGFCYYHYWFNGRRILERPIEEVLSRGTPNFPFMLCWANENWTRIWDGTERNVLLKQEYDDTDAVNHAEYLMRFFLDPRYIKIDGRPVFAIYRDNEIPNVSRYLSIFRDVARTHGLELYLCRFERHSGTRPETPQELGFDAGIEFPPLSPSFSEFTQNFFAQPRTYLNRQFRRAVTKGIDLLGANSPTTKLKIPDAIYDYEQFVEFDLNRKDPLYTVFPGVSPGWDNTARRRDGGATIFRGSNPHSFQKWVMGKAQKFTPKSSEENLFFINAWNEWAEGNHLEPCEKFGLKTLEALRYGLSSKNHDAS
jgi:hypothetical protein